MTYLTGDGSPTFVGMAVFSGCGAAVRSLSEYGQFLYTRSVYSFSLASSGIGRTVSAPDIVVPMYGNGSRRAGAVSSFFSSAGLVNGLAFDWSPFPTPMNRVFPSGETATAVGYQPVGMNPFTWLRSRSSTSTTATQLLSALATNSVFPSG